MNKKNVLISLIFLSVSFCAGIFTEITAPSAGTALPAQMPSVTAAVYECIKSDFFTVVAALVFSCSVAAVPLVPLMIASKTFSLGFSAAFILSASEKASALIMAVLVLRGMFKIPAYIAIILISLETASFVKKNFRSAAAVRRGLPRRLLRFLTCFLCLAVSSIPEAFLLTAGL